MRTAMLLVVALLACAVCALATPALLEEWEAAYDGPEHGNDDGWYIVVDDAGNAYVTGNSGTSGSNNDYATIKYDAHGLEQWVAIYDGGSNDKASAVGIDGYGNTYVTGQSLGSGTNYDYATVKYDADGSEQWVARYNGPANSYDWAWGLRVDQEGNVYVIGRSFGSGTGYDYATIKYDSDGNEQWVARYDGTGEGGDAAYYGIAVDGDGNVHVTGESTGMGTGLDYATVKYDTDGNEQWVARYNGPADDDDSGYHIAVGADGSVYVTGASTGVGTDTDYATIKYGPDGNEEWVARYDGETSQEDIGAFLALDGEGNVFVCGILGKSMPSHTGEGWGIIWYDTDGNEMQVVVHDGAGPDADIARCLALDGEGGVYVTGDCDNGVAEDDIVTVKYQLAVGVSEGEEAPARLLLATPNPLTSETRIGFDVPSHAAWARLAIYNVRGQLVRTLVDGPAAPGWREIFWCGTDERGQTIAAGTYFVRLDVGGETETAKLVVVR